MINVISKTCEHEGCKTQPIYNNDPGVDPSHTGSPG